MTLRARFWTLVLAAALATPADAQQSEPRSRLAIHGSNTVGARLVPALVEGFGTTLGYRTVRIAGAKPEEITIRLQHEDGRIGGLVEIQSHGSGTAVPSLAKRAADLGMLSRRVNAKEIATLQAAGMPDIRQPGLEHIVALDGLAVLVSPDNPVRSLRLDQITGIFSGAIKNWSEVGGPDGAISLHARDDKSGTFDTFDALVLKPANAKLAAAASRYESSEDLSDAVARDPMAIGFVGFAYVRNARALSVAGECGLDSQPTAFSIQTEEYPLSRRLYLYGLSRDRDDMAGLFLTYALSPAAQKVVRSEGFVDLAPALMPEANQLLRLGTAVPLQGSDFDAATFKTLTLDLANSRRISTTFRFDANQAALDPRAISDIARIAGLAKAELDRDPRASLVLAGFTDASGSLEMNVALSATRAQNIRKLVVQQLGPAYANRIATRGYGPLLPAACNSSEDGRNRNRRVEVWVNRTASRPR